tara:strand:- start:7321 stop:7959 length:639 start_codon:yes stop_codon:yes gene_type:complete
MGNVDIRGLQRFTGGGEAEVNIGADKQKNLLVAQGNPPYAEVRRRGDAWTVFTTTAITPLAARPTTTARLELYNNGARAAVVSDLHAWRLLGTAVGVGEVLFAMLTKKAVPTLTAQALYSLSGKDLITPVVTSEMVTGIGTTVVENGWQPYGPPAGYLAAATPGAGWSVPIDGKLQIYPGMSLCLQIVASVATASAFHIGVTWDWVTMSVEA